MQIGIIVSCQTPFSFLKSFPIIWVKGCHSQASLINLPFDLPPSFPPPLLEKEASLSHTPLFILSSCLAAGDRGDVTERAVTGGKLTLESITAGRERGLRLRATDGGSSLLMC